MKAPHWTTRLELALAEPEALRVLDKLSIVRLANDVQPGVSEPTAVLGDSGVWNNYTSWVTAVVPLSKRYATPSLGRRDTAGGTFVFRGLPESVLEAGRQKDRLADGLTYRRATPEAALLHWLYSSESPRSDMSAPPTDINLDNLNRRTLERLSKAMQLDASLHSWLNNKVGGGRRGSPPTSER
jgi:hypothetical protein